MVRTRSQRRKELLRSDVINGDSPTLSKMELLGEITVEGLKKVPQHIINKKKFYQIINDWELSISFEFQFDPDRRWRFDMAFPEHKIAIEIEGGTWVSGRHSRGTGMEKDMEKYAVATSRGWSIMRFSTSMLVNNDYLALLFDLLVLKGAIIDVEK